MCSHCAKTLHCKGTQTSVGKTPRILTRHIRSTQGTNFTLRILHAWGKNPRFQPDRKTGLSRYGRSEEGTVSSPTRFEVQSSTWAPSIIMYHRTRWGTAGANTVRKRVFPGTQTDTNALQLPGPGNTVGTVNPLGGINPTNGSRHNNELSTLSITSLGRVWPLLSTSPCFSLQSGATVFS